MVGNLNSVLIKLLRLAGLIACLIVVASFLVFAANQSNGASQSQAAQVASLSPGTAKPAAAPSKPSAVHRDLDRAANWLTTPFHSFTQFTSQWATLGVRMLLALILYGFCVGYAVRFVRVRES